MKYIFINLVASIIACISIASNAANDAHDHNHVHKMNNSGSCADFTQNAKLECAQTISPIFDRQDRLWIAWAYGSHIYVSYSNDNGAHFSSPRVVNRSPESIAARAENRPKIMIGPKGEIYVTWTQKLKARFSGHIRFSRSINGGKQFSKPITVNDDPNETSHRFEALGVNARGDIFIAWLDKRDYELARKGGRPYNGAALYYSYSTDGGNHFKKNLKIADYSCQCCRVAMAIDNMQLPVMLWRHVYDGNIRDHAIVSFIDHDTPRPVQRASHDYWQIDACPHHGPAIAIDRDNRYHLAWFNNANERHGLFYATATAHATTISKPISFGNYSRNAAHPHLLAIDEHVVLIWREFDGRRYSLYTMVSHDHGRNWSQPRALAHHEGDTGYPYLLASRKTIYATWHRQGTPYRLIEVMVR